MERVLKQFGTGKGKFGEGSHGCAYIGPHLRGSGVRVGLEVGVPGFGANQRSGGRPSHPGLMVEVFEGTTWGLRI